MNSSILCFSGEHSLLIVNSRKGDYYRYLAEFAHKRDRKDYAEKSLNAYKMAYMHALSALDPAHPTRLGLALNFSVFYHGEGYMLLNIHSHLSVF